MTEVTTFTEEQQSAQRLFFSAIFAAFAVIV